MEAVVNMALEYSPESRFRTTADMKQALMVVARKTGALVHAGPTTGPMQGGSGIKALWSFKCEDEIRGTPAVSQGLVYIGSYDNNLYALNAADGKFQWKYPTDGGIVTRPVVLDGNIYFGSEDNVYVVSAAPGKWFGRTTPMDRSAPRRALPKGISFSVPMTPIFMPST
jgi:hypothetical protein